MTTELTTRGGGTLAVVAPTNIAELKTIAAAVAGSGLYGVKKPEEAFVIMMTGMELGLTPMQSLRGIHCIKGKPVLSADMMVALVRASDQCEFFEVESITDEHVAYRTKRRGSGVVQSRSFSMAEARTAGLLGNDNWKKYPKDMLRARCASKLARQEYPEVCLGLYTADELTDGRVIDADFEEVQRTPQAVAETFIDADAAEYQLTEGGAKKRMLYGVMEARGLAKEDALELTSKLWERAALEEPYTAEAVDEVLACDRLKRRLFALLGECDLPKDAVEAARHELLQEGFGAKSMNDLDSAELQTFIDDLSSLSVAERTAMLQARCVIEAHIKDTHPSTDELAQGSK